jgi:hypothetical protein
MENKEIEISLLINAIFYFINCAFTLKEEDQDHYRLVAIKYDKAIIDKYYPTLRGAKISCAKLIKSRGFREELKME